MHPDFKRRLRLLHIVDGFRMGGAENKLCELIAHLNRDKYDITLANVGPTGPLQEHFEKLDIEILDFPRRFAFDPLPFWKLKQYMTKRRIDIAQSTLFWADFVGATAARIAGVPAVLSWETVSHEGDPYHNSFQRRNGYRLAMQCVDKIIAVSHEVKTSLIRRRSIAPDRIRVIHYGVDLTQFHPNGKADGALTLKQELNLQPSSFLIGIVARLERWKGHRNFIEAFARIAERFADAHVLMIGDGSLRQELQDLSRMKNISGRIHFLGVRNDVPRLVNYLDLFVLPSLPGEGLPNVLLEAMACAKPVIATTVGGIPELVRQNENGFLVPTNNIDALHQALSAALTDRERLHELGMNGHQTVKSGFTLQQQITAFENSYDTLYRVKSQQG